MPEDTPLEEHISEDALGQLDSEGVKKHTDLWVHAMSGFKISTAHYSKWYLRTTLCHPFRPSDFQQMSNKMLPKGENTPDGE